MRIALRVSWIALAASCQRTDRREQPVPAAVSTPGPASTPVPDPPHEDRPPPPPLPDPLPGTRKDLSSVIGTASRAAIGDFDGDGKREIAVVDSSKIQILDATGKLVASMPVTDGVLRLVAADLDGDGTSELYAGWGQTRDHMACKAKVTVHRLEHGKLTSQTVLAPDTTRQEIVALVPMPETSSLLIGYFDSKYMVTSTIASKDASGWTANKLASIRTATSYARGDVTGDGKPDLVVGRIYGDDKGIDGDAFVLAADGTRTRIPSTRGMRSIAVADADGDGKPEVYLGDGWHQNFGQHAHGLLTRARFVNGAFTTDLVEDTPGQYAIEDIIPASIDGKPVLVAVGNKYTRVFRRAGDTWQAITIGGAARDVAVGDLDGIPGDEILILADRSELVNLHGASWR